MKEILLTSSALILALLALRRLFRKVLSRRAQYALWGLVLLRLLVPVNLPAAGFSLLTAAKPAADRVEALYIAPDSVTTWRADGGYLYGAHNAPPVAIGPATPDSTYAFDYQDAMGNPAEGVGTYQRQIALSDLLPPIWYAGCAVMACWLVLSNLLFWRKLRRARRPYPVEGSPRRVYLVEEGLPSPCLFGLFRPAIYLTPAALQSPDRLRHVLAHEETHARHLDPLWSLLRAVCLTVYWFDPLVWWAPDPLSVLPGFRWRPAEPPSTFSEDPKASLSLSYPPPPCSRRFSHRSKTHPSRSDPACRRLPR